MTDGSQVLYGCISVEKSGAQTSWGCNDPDIRSQNFAFQPGERVTSLTLWPGYNPQKVPNQRGGALSLVTSRVSIHITNPLYTEHEFDMR
jgi:hypothetical protein